MLYSNLVLTEKLFPHLSKIDITCWERLEIIKKSMMQQKGINEALKASGQLEWVRCMNNIHNKQKKLFWLNLYMFNGRCPVITCMADNGH